MQKSFYILFILLATFTLSAQEVTNYLPADAAFVGKISGASLSNKASLEYIEKLPVIQDLLKGEFQSKGFSSLSEVGMDFNKDLYCFSEMSDSLSMLYFLIPLLDSGAFERNMAQDIGTKELAERAFSTYDAVFAWNEKVAVIAVGEMNESFPITDSLFKQKYGIGSSPYDDDYGYGYDNYESHPVYTEDGDVYYSDEVGVETAEDAVNRAMMDAVDAVKDAADDAADADYEEIDVEEVEPTYEEYETQGTYWENGVEYYMNGEPVEITTDYYGDSNDGYSYNEEYVDPYETYYQKKDSIARGWMLVRAKTLISSKVKNITRSSDVNKIINAKSDASLYLNYSDLMQFYMKLIASQQFYSYNPYSPDLDALANMYGGMKFQADLKFRKDDIFLNSTYTMDDKSAEMYNGIMDSKFNKKFLKHLDMNNALAYYSMSLSTEALMDIYPKLISQYMGVIPEMSEAGPAIADLISIMLDEEAIAELMPGNMIAICDGFSMQKVSYTTYDYDENFNMTEVVKEQESELPSVLIMIESKNSDPLQKLMRLAEQADEVTRTSYGFEISGSRDLPVTSHIVFKDDIIYICNDKNKMESIVAGKTTGSINKKHKKLLKGNNVVAYIDAEKIMEVVPYSPYSEKDKASWELLKKKLKDMEIVQFQKDKNTIVSTMKISTPESMENTWKYLFDSFNEFFLLQTGK